MTILPIHMHVAKTAPCNGAIYLHLLTPTMLH